MKHLFITMTISLISFCQLFAQSQYEQGMQQAFKLWEDKKPMEAVALFERIAQAEVENWIPVYHAANILIVNSFGITDMSKREATLDKATALIQSAHQRSENNSEITTLEGMLLTGYLAMDPETYGMTYSAKIPTLHQKAIEQNPDNPRAYANMIEYEMGAAQFFGQDVKVICQKMKEIIPKFKNQKVDAPFAPSYGLERAEQVVANCNE